jgi:hypothetical protein
MSSMSPQPENDRSSSFYPWRIPSGPQPQAGTPINEGKLPPTELSHGMIDDGKRLLTSERFGIRYGDVLADIAKSPWRFSSIIDMESAELAKKLISFNVALEREYAHLCSSEGLLSWLRASLPFFRRPLASDLFLTSMLDINHIVRDLKHAGLITIDQAEPDTVLSGDRLSPVYVGNRSSSIVVSNLGTLVIQS